MTNKFMNGVNATREAMEAKKAEETAQTIKQYCGIDAYNQFKEGKLFPIVVDGVLCGLASSKEEADKGIEYLSHFTGGKPLTKENLYSAGMNMKTQTKKGYEVHSSGVEVKDTYVINGKEYIVDDTNELYTIEGEHITNVADIIEAKDSIGEKLYLEILTNRITKYEEEKDQESEDEYDEYDEYDDEDDDIGGHAIVTNIQMIG